MYIVHHIRLCILTTTTSYETEIIAETKINDAAARNAPGSLGGSRTALGVPRRAQGMPCKALPMRNVKNELRGTHIKIRTSKRFALVVPYKASSGPSEGPQGWSWNPRGIPGVFLAAAASIFVSDNLRLT